MTDVFKIGISMALSNNVSQVLSVIARDFMGVRGAIGKTEAAMARLKGVMLGVGAVMAGSAMIGGVVKLVEHGEKLVHQQALMAEKGMTIREQAEATAAAYKTASDVMGTNVSRNAALIMELRGILGSTADALTSLPQFAKAGELLASLKGGKAGENDLATMAKALELRGDLINAKTGKIDPESLRAGLDQAFRTMSASGGLISSKDLMGVMKQAGPMARMMTAQQFYDTAFSAIMEMGGQRAGTALSSVGRAIYGGIMPKRNATEFERLGLLAPSAVQHLGAGATQINPAGFTGVDTLNKQGLLAYVQEVIRPAMEHAGIRGGADQQKELYRLFPTETARRMIGLFLQQAETVKRDIGMRGQAQGVDDAYKTGIQNDPTIKIKAFHEAWDNLMTSLGAPLVKPATDAMVWLAKQLNQITMFFAAHPDGARLVGEFTAALGRLLVLGGSLKIMSVALGPFAAGIRALAGTVVLFGPGAQAATALRALSAVGGVGSLFGLAGGVIALGAAVAGIAWLMKSNDPDNHFHGSGLGGGRGGTWDKGAPPKSSIENWWDSFSAAPSAAPGANARRGSIPAPAAAGQNAQAAPAAPVNVQTTNHIYIDSKRIQTTRTTTPGVQSGTTGYDPRMSLMPAGLPVGGG